MKHTTLFRVVLLLFLSVCFFSSTVVAGGGGASNDGTDPWDNLDGNTANLGDVMIQTFSLSNGNGNNQNQFSFATSVLSTRVIIWFFNDEFVSTQTREVKEIKKTEIWRRGSIRSSKLMR